MNLIVYTDGASSGNPGPGWAMWVIGSIKQRERLPHCTNNEAEYLAVIGALKQLIAQPELWKGKGSVDFRLDSKLVVEQINGRWRVKEPRMAQFLVEIKTLRSQLSIPAQFTHILRDGNKADALKYGP